MVVSSAVPRGVLSRSALTRAATVAVEAGGSIADLRRDAWGHGVLSVAHAATIAGADAVLVDSPAQVDALRLEGIDAVVDATADIDPRLLYGLPDATGSLASDPVLRLVGRVMSTKRLKPGDAVSYGYTFRARTATRVALVTGGYAQGVVRSLGNRAAVEIGGELRPIVGRVAMDVCVVDLEGGDAEIGAEATYFGGRGPAAGALASWATITGLTVAELVVVTATHSTREWES